MDFVFFCFCFDLFWFLGMENKKRNQKQISIKPCKKSLNFVFFFYSFLVFRIFWARFLGWAAKHWARLGTGFFFPETRKSQKIKKKTPQTLIFTRLYWFCCCTCPSIRLFRFYVSYSFLLCFVHKRITFHVGMYLKH